MSDPENRGEEFREFISLLPEQYEIALTSDTVATAFFQARLAGWPTERLAADSEQSLARGGVGLVVNRLRSLAENPPSKRVTKPKTSTTTMALPECQSCAQPYRRGSVQGGPCVTCGEPLVLIVYQTTMEAR
jgi:hypothetical protein